jgi:hypothetical protein
MVLISQLDWNSQTLEKVLIEINFEFSTLGTKTSLNAVLLAGADWSLWQ